MTDKDKESFYAKSKKSVPGSGEFELRSDVPQSTNPWIKIPPHPTPDANQYAYYPFQVQGFVPAVINVQNNFTLIPTQNPPVQYPQYLIPPVQQETPKTDLSYGLKHMKSPRTPEGARKQIYKIPNIRQKKQSESQQNPTPVVMPVPPQYPVYFVPMVISEHPVNPQSDLAIAKQQDIITNRNEDDRNTAAILASLEKSPTEGKRSAEETEKHPSKRQKQDNIADILSQPPKTFEKRAKNRMSLNNILN